jgi:hypothetical protein
MVGADILAEIRLRADEIRSRMHWTASGLAPATALALAIMLARLLLELPDEVGPPLTATLVGAAVWGAP